MATEEPLSKEGRDLKVRCKAMAFYEIRFRLRTHEKDRGKAALVQFLSDDGRPITEEHVSAGFSEEVGRYSYLKADPKSGLGVVRFFAPTSGGRITLRFRTWSNRHPVFLGRDISVRQLASWTIAAEPGNAEPVRLTPVARPLSVPVPAGSTVRLSIALRSAADGDRIVLHAPCAMAMEGGRLRLGEASGEAGSARPLAGRGTQVVLPVENAGQMPVVLSLACEGVAAVDIAEVSVFANEPATGSAADAPGRGRPAPAGSSPSASLSSGNGERERVRWATKVGNRLFLRSTIIDTKQELTLTAAKVSQIERTLEDSLLLVEKKVDYLLAKIDAYADVDDRNGAAFHEGLVAVRQVTKDLGKIVSTNQAELRHGQNTLDARLTTIEQGNADLATDLTAVRQAGQELGEAVKAGRKAMDARLVAIERGNADLASELAAVRQAGQELGEAVKANQAKLESNQEAIDARLAALEQTRQELGETFNANQAKLESNQEAIDARLAAIELGNADLAKRLDAAIERLAHIETAHADTVANIEKSAKHTVADINRNVEKTAFNEFRQHVALDALQQLLKFDLPLPATRGWAASPDFLLHFYQHIATHRPKTVVELGSGVSTLVAAAALAANGDGGRLYSLDHDGAYAEATSKLVAQHGFPNIATIYHASLTPWKPARPTELGEEWQWYAVPRAVKSLKAIDLLVVDGPPKATGPHARYPAIPHFYTRMAPGCTVLLDDARRPDEKVTAEAWSHEYGLTLELLLRTDSEFEKGLAILTVEGATAKDNPRKAHQKGK